MRWLLTVALAAADAQFALYADCGSTGTRVYTVKPGTTEGKENVFTVKKLGKLPAVSKDVEAVADSLSHFADEALIFVPKGQRLRVRALGTAGMRKMSEHEQWLVWEKIRQELHATYRLIDVETRTISGDEEGRFGLVGANYLHRMFGSSAEPIGILDLGGSSTQVALPGQGHPAVEIRGDELVRSYDWGMERAREEMAVRACFYWDAAGQERGTPPEDGKKGTGNAEECRAAIRTRLATEQEKCRAEGSGCLGEDIPWGNHRLLAMSGFFYVADFAEWSLQHSGTGFAGYPTPAFEANKAAAGKVQNLAEGAIQLCNKSEKGLLATREPHPYTNHEKLTHRCFEICYMLELFRLYQIPDDGRVQFVDEIEGHDVEWTLGAHVASTFSRNSHAEF